MLDKLSSLLRSSLSDRIESARDTSAGCVSISSCHVGSTVKLPLACLVTADTATASYDSGVSIVKMVIKDRGKGRL